MKRLPFCLLLLVVAAAGCQDPVMPTCDPCITTAVVYGSVVDSDHAPVASLPVLVLAYRSPLCDGGFVGWGDLRTASLGEYGGLMGSLYSPSTVRCFEVTINADSSATWPTETFVFQDSVEFRDELHGEPRDSIRIDLVLGTGNAGGGGSRINVWFTSTPPAPGG